MILVGKYQPIALLLSIVTCISGCDGLFENTVELKVPEHESHFAINARFSSADTIHSLFVFESKGILEDSPYEGVEDAVVSLALEQDRVSDFKYIIEDKEFRSINTFLLNEPDKDYTLNIRHHDLPEVAVTQTLPTKIEITSIDLKEKGGVTRDGFTTDQIEIGIDDPMDEKNYYLIELFLQREIKNADSTYLQIDRLIPETNNVDLQWYEGSYIFNDRNFNGENIKLIFLGYLFSDTPSVLIVKLSTINESAFLFFQSVINYRKANGNIFAEPVTIKGNIPNGFGVFSLENTSITEKRF